MIIKRDKTDDAQCNYLPPTGQCQTSLPETGSALLLDYFPSVHIPGMTFSSFGLYRSPVSQLHPFSISFVHLLTGRV